MTATLFFLPNCLLGTISPLVVKLALKELATTYMADATGLVLTDDHAPVDQLIAVLFDERGR